MSQISTPVSAPAAAIPAASTQLTMTLAAVSWSGVAAIEGITVDWAGRVAVTAVEATTAAAYAANGTPAEIATAVAAIAAACTR